MRFILGKKVSRRSRIFYLRRMWTFSKTKPQEYVEKEIERSKMKNKYLATKHEWVCGIVVIIEAR